MTALPIELLRTTAEPVESHGGLVVGPVVTPQLVAAIGHSGGEL